MTAFDQILKGMGCVPMVYSVEKRTMIPASESNRTIYSTMGELVLCWHDQHGGHIATTGLHDCDHGPTLVWPRPDLVVQEELVCGLRTFTYSTTTAAQIDRMVSKVGAAEVLRMGMANEPWTDPSILEA